MIYSGIKGSVPLLKAAPRHCQPSLHTIKGLGRPSPRSCLPGEGNQTKPTPPDRPRQAPAPGGALLKDSGTRGRSGPELQPGKMLQLHSVLGVGDGGLGFGPRSQEGMLGAGVLLAPGAKSVPAAGAWRDAAGAAPERIYPSSWLSLLLLIPLDPLQQLSTFCAVKALQTPSEFQPGLQFPSPT